MFTDSSQNRRVCKPLAKLEYSNTRTPPININEKVALKKEFFALIDCLLNELNERFTQSGLDKVVSMETILIRTINREKIELSEIKKLLGIHVTDFNVDQLAARLIMLPNILNSDNPSATIKDIVEIFKMLPETSRQLLNQVERLIILLYTILAASSTSQRLFSGLRRLKAYTRSTMSQKRLTHLLLLHLNQTIFCEISLDDILKEFISRTAERKSVFGKM